MYYIMTKKMVYAEHTYWAESNELGIVEIECTYRWSIGNFYVQHRLMYVPSIFLLT